MDDTEVTHLLATLTAHSVFLQKEVGENTGAVAALFAELVCTFGIPRIDFRELHWRYQPVPEVYLLTEQFDRFCPPRRHLDKLGLDTDDLESFIEALGCYTEPSEKDLEELNSCLYVAIPRARTNSHTGIVLMCWERIEAFEQKSELAVAHLLHVVGFHEHSHAARASTLSKGKDSGILRAEETVAQWETHMFLRSRRHSHIESTIETMKKLMRKQPSCYQIPI